MKPTTWVGAVTMGLMLPAALATAGGDRPLKELKLRLAWFDVSGAAAPIESAAARELSDLFAPAAIEVDWTRAFTGVRAPDSDVQIIVLEHAPGMARGVMGAAHHSNVRPHSVWVYLRHVRGTLGLGPRADGAAVPPAEHAMLGRAVGRVVAHEIIHAYAPGRDHEAKGLMRARLDARFLKQKHVELEKAQADVVVGGLRNAGSILAAPQE